MVLIVKRFQKYQFRIIKQRNRFYNRVLVKRLGFGGEFAAKQGKLHDKAKPVFVLSTKIEIVKNYFSSS